MRVLITGGTGFIGAKTVIALKREGYDVRVFSGNVQNVSDWENELSQTDIIFHAAGIRTETKKDFDINTKGTQNLFTAIEKSGCKSKRVVFVSSQAVYSGNKPPYKESMKVVDPITVYGKSKYDAEKIARSEGKRLGIDVVILRFAAVLGSGIREQSNMSGSLARWVKAGLEGKPIVVYKDPNRIRNYVHVDDVVLSNVLAVGKLPPGIYNVCGDEKIKLIDLAEIIKKITGGISDVRIISVPLPPGDSGDQTASNEKLKSFGWKPEHTIEEAVREYVYNLKFKVQNAKLQ